MADRQIILLSYVNRSGSTFLLSTLNKWPEICCCPEAEVLMELLLFEPQKIVSASQIKKLEYALINDYKLKHWKLKPDTILPACNNKKNSECFAEILNAFCDMHKPQAKFVVFKAEYLIFLYEKLRNFNCLWIDLVRDPRAVYNSQSKTINPYTGKPFSENIYQFAFHWNRHVKQALKHFKATNCQIIFYEDLIGDYTKCINAVASFIKIDILNFSKVQISDSYFMLPEQQNIHRNHGFPPIPQCVDKWRKHIDSKALFVIRICAFRGLHNLPTYTIPPAAIDLNKPEKVKVVLRIGFELFRYWVRQRFKNIINQN